MKNEKLRMKNYSITPKPKLQFLIPLIPQILIPLIPHTLNSSIPHTLNSLIPQFLIKRLQVRQSLIDAVLRYEFIVFALFNDMTFG